MKTPFKTIINFNQDIDGGKWVVTDDTVMGGKSAGSFEISKENYGIFKGKVSLQNNGGFSSVRHKFKQLEVINFNTIVLQVKGDGKKYQFRIKASSTDAHSYIASFTTTENWKKITIPLKDMYPAFRGKKLNMPNFCNKFIEEIAFLIGNKKQESFELLIDSIKLQ